MNTYQIVGGKAKNIKGTASAKLNSLDQIFFQGDIVVSGVKMTVELNNGHLNGQEFLICELTSDQRKQIGLNPNKTAKIAFDIPAGIVGEGIALQKKAYSERRAFELATNINGDY